jgi:hypothetical protein
VSDRVLYVVGWYDVGREVALRAAAEARLVRDFLRAPAPRVMRCGAHRIEVRP